VRGVFLILSASGGVDGIVAEVEAWFLSGDDEGACVISLRCGFWGRRLRCGLENGGGDHEDDQRTRTSR